MQCGIRRVLLTEQHRDVDVALTPRAQLPCSQARCTEESSPRRYANRPQRWATSLSPANPVTHALDRMCRHYRGVGNMVEDHPPGDSRPSDSASSVGICEDPSSISLQKPEAESPSCNLYRHSYHSSSVTAWRPGHCHFFRS